MCFYTKFITELEWMHFKTDSPLLKSRIAEMEVQNRIKFCKSEFSTLTRILFCFFVFTFLHLYLLNAKIKLLVFQLLLIKDLQRKPSYLYDILTVYLIIKTFCAPC